jgi:hypothetical protein
MLIPRQSPGVVHQPNGKPNSKPRLAGSSAILNSTDGISMQACQRFVTELPGPAIAVARHPNAGFATWISSGVCKIDAEAASLDKCGFWACNNGKNATKCFIQGSEGLC